MHKDKSTAPPGYELLGPGSLLTEGDMCWNDGVGFWRAINWSFGHSTSEWPNLPFARKKADTKTDKVWLNSWD